MKYIYIFIIIFITFAGVTQAQEVQKIKIGTDTVEYTETFKDIENAISYYYEDNLVMTAFDENKDGKVEMWVLYRDDLSVLKEMTDSDGDGEPDMFFEYDTEENLTKSYGDGLKQFEIETTKVENDNVSLDKNIDYAGNLEDIQKLAGESESFISWFFILIVVGIGIWWWKRKKV